MAPTVEALLAFGHAIEPIAPAASSTADVIGRLHRRVALAGVAVALLVGGILLYAVRAEGRDGVDHLRRYELAWVAGSAAALGGVGIAAARALRDPALAGGANGGEEDTVEVRVTAERFAFRFAYPGVDVEAADDLVIPAGRPVRLTITAADVVHSFHVPALGLKATAIPGEERAIRTTPTREGTYRGYCAEYCGTGHTGMRFDARVVDGAAFDTWLSERAVDPSV